MPCVSESVTQGRLDLALLNSLQIDPRASWARVGSALNISPGAAARRWERLARSGTAWVTAHPGPHFGTAHCFAFVAVRCEPGRKVEVADTLAGDPHAVSVEITAGGADLFLTVATTDLNAFGRYLLERVDRLPGVTATESSLVSQMFGEGGQWRLGVLDAEQKAALRSAGTPDAVPHHRPLTELEQRLFLGLCEDGRTSHEGLADLVGTSPATVRRRLHGLFSGAGVVGVRCDVASTHVGLPVTASLRARVPPHQLQQAGHTLAQVPQVRMCAAVTGEHNLVISAWLRTVGDVQQLEAEIAHRLPHVVLTDRTITLRMVKRMGRLLDERGCATSVVPMALWSDPSRTES